jgi:hypothetical protein
MARQLAKSHGKAVKVGFVGDKADADHEGGLNNLELAVIHEYGAPRANIPARPFVRPAFDAHRKEYQTALAKGMVGVLAGRDDYDKLLGRIGAKAAADMKAYVTAGPHIPPPLKPATVVAKGSDRPLVDTGRMVGSISWQVEE